MCNVQTLYKVLRIKEKPDRESASLASVGDGRMTSTT